MKLVWKDNQRVWRDNKKERERERAQERERWVGRESRKRQESRKRRARARGEEGGRERWNAGVSEGTAERGGGRGWDAESGKESDDEERGGCMWHGGL